MIGGGCTTARKASCTIRPFSPARHTSSRRHAGLSGRWYPRNSRADAKVWTCIPNERMSRANAFRTVLSSSITKTVGAVPSILAPRAGGHHAREPTLAARHAAMCQAHPGQGVLGCLHGGTRLSSCTFSWEIWGGCLPWTTEAGKPRDDAGDSAIALWKTCHDTHRSWSLVVASSALASGMVTPTVFAVPTYPSP